MPYLSAADILKKDAFKYEEMEVEEWGGKLRYRTISGTDRDMISAKLAKAEASGDPDLLIGIQALLISLSACDAEGKRIFATEDQVKALNDTQPGAVIVRIYKAVAALNKLDQGAVEEEGKESSAPESGTDSDSPST